MTEDYKENLLDYVTGNLEEGTPTSDEIFKEQIELNRNKWKNYIPNGWNNFRIEGLLKSKTNDMIVLYGGYLDPDNNAYGLIYIVDNNFNPIKAFYEFSSGTKLRYIQCMNQDADGTFYFIDDTIYSNNNPTEVLTSQKRFVMVNNFTSDISGTYLINLRTSYILGDSYKNIYCKQIEKDINSAHYVMIGTKTVERTNRFAGVIAVELIINVGTANEWSKVETGEENENLIHYGGSIIQFNNENKSYYRVLGDKFADAGTYCLTKGYNNNSFTQTAIYNSPGYNDDIIETEYYSNQCVFLNQNEVYFVLTNQHQTWNGQSENKHIALIYYNFSTSQARQIYDESLGQAVYNNIAYIGLSANQGSLYLTYTRITNSNYANYYVQRFTGEWNPQLIGSNKLCSINQRSFYVDNDYNIVKIFMYPNNFRNATWYFAFIKEIYNPTQYNGEPYEGVDALVPKYGNLYSNGSLVFSRNLYNISKQNNTTMSSVEIPNTYLNNSTITQNDLISKTNLQMNSDNTEWTKNIYEVVDLSYINTISVIDEDTGIQYRDSAIKVNNSTTDGGSTNYTNTKCTKYRINYSDNTTSIKPIYWNVIDTTHKETMITFYVDKAISSIDFISNDETVKYLNIPLEVEIGKYYSISQKIRID